MWCVWSVKRRWICNDLSVRWKKSNQHKLSVLGARSLPYLYSCLYWLASAPLVCPSYSTMLHCPLAIEHDWKKVMFDSPPKDTHTSVFQPIIGEISPSCFSKSDRRINDRKYLAKLTLFSLCLEYADIFKGWVINVWLENAFYHYI